MRRTIFVTTLLLLCIVSFISVVSAVPEELPNPIFHPTNFSELPTVNASDYWITDIGALGTVNSAQFDNIGGTLTIDESHFDLLYCQLTGCDMSGDINMQGNDIINVDFLNTSGNVEVDGFIKVGNYSLTTLGPGSIGAENKIFSGMGIATRSAEFGLGLNVFSSDSTFTISSLGGTADLNVTTQLFCDTTNPFSESNVRDVVSIVSSSPIDTSGAQGQIEQYINSSCVVLSFCSAGDIAIQDLNTISYFATEAPDFFVFDQGCAGFTIGSHPDANFEIYNPNATGSTNFFTSIVAGTKQTSAGAFRVDANGNKDVTSVVSVYITGSETNDSRNSNLILANNLISHNRGTFNIIEAGIINYGINVTTNALSLPPTDNIIVTTREIAPSAAYYWNGTEYIDILAVAGAAGQIEMFEEPGTFACLGNDINFTISVASLLEGASESIIPQTLYPNDGVYVETIPRQDSTNGFQNDGEFVTEVLVNRTAVNYGPNGISFANTNNYTYVCINRTNTNTFTQTPIFQSVSIFDEQFNMFINADETSGEFGGIGFENIQQNKPGGAVSFYKGFVGSIPEYYFGIQTGLNDSASFIRNSFCSMSTRNVTDEQKDNLTYLFDCEQRILDMGISGRQDFYSPGKGASLFSEYDIGTQFLHLYNDIGNGGLQGEGSFDFSLFGNDANFFNGSVHNFIPVTYVEGFLVGDIIQLAVELFSSNLGIFTNDPGNINDWIVVSSSYCDEGLCARAQGNGGAVLMNTTFSTLNTNETNVTFVYSLLGLVGADNFNIYVNNNEGSGDVLVFTDAGTEDKVYENITLSSLFWNKSAITITVECDASQTTRFCWFDTFKTFGTAIIDTAANVSGFDSEFCFSDGIRGSDGQCSRGMYYNASADTTFFNGPVNFTGTSSGLTGSGSTNNLAKWGSSTSLTNSLIVDNGTLITLGADTLIQGETTLQGNANVTGNLTANDRYYLGNGASIGYNATCAFIFYNQTGSIIETKGCV